MHLGSGKKKSSTTDCECIERGKAVKNFEGAVHVSKQTINYTNLLLSVNVRSLSSLRRYLSLLWSAFYLPKKAMSALNLAVRSWSFSIRIIACLLFLHVNY